MGLFRIMSFFLANDAEIVRGDISISQLLIFSWLIRGLMEKRQNIKKERWRRIKKERGRGREERGKEGRAPE